MAETIDSNARIKMSGVSDVVLIEGQYGGEFNEDRFNATFDQMDVNGDGSVDKEELRAFLHKIATAQGFLE